MLTMSIAYAAIAIHFGNWWPWLEIVHESGDKTLIDTILYFEHAARELPLDIIFGVAIGGSVLWILPRNRAPSKRFRSTLITTTFLVIAIIMLGTVSINGFTALSDNLLQMHTRPGEPLDFGSHWRYHLFSRLSLILVSFGLPVLIVKPALASNQIDQKSARHVYFWCLVLFIVLTSIFGLTAEPFTNPVYLGHQARELVTHGLVTLPLAWWACMVLNNGSGQPSPGKGPLALPLVSGILGLLIALYVMVGALLTSAVSQGQTTNLVLLVFPHFFEHFFSYLVVPLVALVVCSRPVQRN
jgi:hypothetical protein